ncbi:MAG: FAD-dependent oxidoreductase [Woeseiaceae bacterium]|nr:FAD-dependent oxidoreductase [Woeseiaceae bacterium]
MTTTDRNSVSDRGTVVVVGAGHAAGQLVASLRQKGHTGRILLFGEESYLPYQRPPLSKKFLAGEMPAERLYVKPANFFPDHDIETHLDTRITRLDPEQSCIETSAGERFDYDSLVLALGATPRRLPIPGLDLPNIHVLRSIDDVRGIRESLSHGKRLAIVGGGYIGLEVASVATTLGQRVTVIEAASRVMSRVVSPPVSEFYETLHRDHGVVLRLGQAVSAIEKSDGALRVCLAGGHDELVDTVLVGVGIVPNTALAAEAGLAVDDGIVVDEHCRTDRANVYAIGDCTSHPNALLQRRLRLESVHNALEQAKVAAANICGEDVEYAQVPWFWSDQYDVKLQIAGMSQGYDQVVMRGSPESGSFSCLYLRDGQLIAVDAINRPLDFVHARPLIAKGVSPAPDLLADTDRTLKELLV